MFSSLKDYFVNLSTKGIAGWVGGTALLAAAAAGTVYCYTTGKGPFNKKEEVKGPAAPAVAG